MSGDVVGQMFPMLDRDTAQKRLDETMVDPHLCVLAEAVEDLVVVLLVSAEPHVRESGQRSDDLLLEMIQRSARLHREGK